MVKILSDPALGVLSYSTSGNRYEIIHTHFELSG